jgi:DNA-binding NarL/FixJ family response regulator
MHGRFAPLDDQEQHVVQLVLAGCSARQVAEATGRQPRLVEEILTMALRKLVPVQDRKREQ